VAERSAGKTENQKDGKRMLRVFSTSHTKRDKKSRYESDLHYHSVTGREKRSLWRKTDEQGKKNSRETGDLRVAGPERTSTVSRRLTGGYSGLGTPKRVQAHRRCRG